MEIPQLVITLRDEVREPIEDHTGLEGRYSSKLTFLEQAFGPGEDTDNVPSIFTTLREQLGLKLERTTVRSPAVVIDHIERPTPN